MFSCSEARHLMADFVASGEPNEAMYRVMREHVAQCEACSAKLEYLRAVETALLTMPRAVPSPRLHRILLEQALYESNLRLRAKPGVAGQLGWDVLAPLLTLLLALIITAQFMPTDVWVAARQVAAEVGTLSQPVPVDELLAGQALTSGHIIFWATWVAMAVVLCGFGLAWAMSAWSDAYDRRLDELQTEVRHAAERLLHRT